MGVLKAEPTGVGQWTQRAVGIAWRAYDVQLTIYAMLLASIGLAMAYTNSVAGGGEALGPGAVFTRGLSPLRSDSFRHRWCCSTCLGPACPARRQGLEIQADLDEYLAFYNFERRQIEYPIMIDPANIATLTPTAITPECGMGVAGKVLYRHARDDGEARCPEAAGKTSNPRFWVRYSTLSGPAGYPPPLHPLGDGGAVVGEVGLEGEHRHHRHLRVDEPPRAPARPSASRACSRSMPAAVDTRTAEYIARAKG